jgi:hypothetical protein
MSSGLGDCDRPHRVNPDDVSSSPSPRRRAGENALAGVWVLSGIAVTRKKMTPPIQARSQSRLSRGYALSIAPSAPAPAGAESGSSIEQKRKEDYPKIVPRFMKSPCGRQVQYSAFALNVNFGQANRRDDSAPYPFQVASVKHGRTAIEAAPGIGVP